MENIDGSLCHDFNDSLVEALGSVVAPWVAGVDPAEVVDDVAAADDDDAMVA